MFQKIAQKFALVIVIALIFGLFVFPVNASSEYVPVNPLTTNLVSWWSMDEVSGVRSDAFGTNTLTDVGGVGSAVGVVANSAVPDVSKYLSIPDNASLSMGDIDFTVCSWVYLTDYSSYYFVNKANEYSLSHHPTSHLFRFTVSYNGSNTVTVNSTTVSTLNTWYMVCGFHDALNNVIKVSVNQASDTLAHSLGVFDGASPLVVGFGVAWYQGRIDNTFIYKRVLSDGEIEYLYNGGLGRAFSDLVSLPTATNTSLPATATNTSLPATVTNTPLPIPTDTSLPATAINTPLPTATFTPDPLVTPTLSVAQVFTSNVGQNHYFVLALPLLFIDWQIAIVWIIAVVNNNISVFLQSLPYKGYEIFITFFIVGLLRRFFFKEK